MKAHLPLFFLVVSVNLAFLSSPSNAEETSIWLAGNARMVAGGMLLPDKIGGFDLEIDDATGVNIGEKPPGKGDSKSLEFTGEQVSVFRTAIPFPPVTASLKIELEAMIPLAAAGEDATLLRHGTQWEIRYTTRNASLAFIVWHDTNVFSEVRVPVRFDEWNTITAEYKEGELLIQVADVSEKATPSDVLRRDAGTASLLMGASSTKVSEEARPRLFHGSIANVRISLE